MLETFAMRSAMSHAQQGLFKSCWYQSVPVGEYFQGVMVRDLVRSAHCLTHLEHGLGSKDWIPISRKMVLVERSRTRKNDHELIGRFGEKIPVKGTGRFHE